MILFLGRHAGVKGKMEGECLTCVGVKCGSLLRPGLTLRGPGFEHGPVLRQADGYPC